MTKRKTLKLKLNSVNGLITILTLLLSTFLIFNVFRYAQISFALFLLSILIIILFNVLSVLLDFKAQGHPTLRIISIAYTIFLLLLIFVGNYYFVRIRGAVGKVIINTEETQYEDVTTSFVSFDNTSLKSIKDLDGKIVGFVDNESIQEGNLLSKQELSDQNVNVVYKAYANYTDLLLALFNKEVDAAPLPEDYYAMFVSNEGYSEYLDKTNVFYSFTKKVAYSGQAQSDINITSEPFTILLIGNADGLSDTLILATFNPQTMTATMTSVARDSFVPIACYPNQAKDKITHARSVSRQCTVDTVSNLLDVKIDYFVEVNFQAVVDIVDALGGLYLYSPVKFVGQDASSTRGNFTVWVGEGWQQMDGLQALAFARERHHMPNGDLDRQVHQQEVISAIITNLMDTKNISTLVNVVEAAGDNVKTNIPLDQMIKLAQYMINKMNASTIDSSYLLQIKSSRLSGYFSWNYNEKLELPLSIFKLFDGAINDAKTLINQNLMQENYVPTANTYFNFDIAAPYVTPTYIKEYYEEKEVHDPLPDFMPSMTNTSKLWYLKDVQTWAANRPWIKLTIDEVWPDESGYIDSYAFNQVVSQSTKYGVLTSKINELTIGVIKRDLDCSILDNQKDPQCINIVPDFTGMKLVDVDTWSTKFNFPVTVITINETDAGYDRAKVGIISNQLEKAYSKLNQLKVDHLTVYTMAYPMITFPVQTMIDEHWTKTQMDTWFKENMYVKPVYVYTNVSSLLAKDTVLGFKLNNVDVTQNSVLQTNVSITVILSAGSAPVGVNSTLTTTLNTPLSGNLQATSTSGVALTFSLVTNGANGSVVLNSNGAFTYTPNANFTGVDSFTFKANDGLLNSDPSTVTITVH